MKFFNKIGKPKIRYALDDLQSDEIILHHHLGLGDHITCNGLVNYLSEEFKTIYLPVKEKNFKTINYLYQDNPKIKLLKLLNKNSNLKNLTQKDIESISNLENSQINDYAKKGISKF